MDIISDLPHKQTSVEIAAQQAIQNEAVLSELLNSILSHRDEERYPAFQVVLIVSEQQPAALYPAWKQFESMLGSQNSYFRSIALQVIANLAKADTENHFEKIFDSYFNVLRSNKTITAIYATNNAWKIALAKPELQGKITNLLLNIDRIHQGKQKDLLKGHAIESFSRYYGEVDTADQGRILEFVKKECTSCSPRTSKAARAFLKEWE
jgi:hypothetical protein